MFIPSFGEIFVVLIISIIFFKTEDWAKIFQKWREFKNFLIKFSNSSKETILNEITEIEKEILKNQILNEIKQEKITENQNIENDSSEKNSFDFQANSDPMVKKNISYKVFQIGSKKYIFGEDGNLHEVFDFDSK